MVGEGGVEDRVGEKERLAQVRGKSGEGTIVVRREKLHSFSQLTSSFGKNYSASMEQVSTSFLLITYKQMGK